MTDFDQAAQFLETLDPDATKFLFVTFDDKKDSKNYDLTRTYYGRFEDYKVALENLNKSGAGIYVTINKTKGNRRRNEDVVVARAVWQDDDSNVGNKTSVEPHIVVNSSPGKYHRYWLIEPQEDIDEWGRIQRGMVKYGCDPGCIDAARILRLPGFVNNKYGESHLVTLEQCSDSPRLDWSKFTRALGYERINPEPDGPADSAGDSTLNRYIKQITIGAHLHSPLRAIMMLNANKGVDIEFNRVQCTGLIHACPDEDRKRRALSDLEAMLKATYRKIEEEQGDTIKPSDLQIEKTDKILLNWPPGLMGELANAANEFFVIPNQTVATMTALSLVAGIAGRKYNISSSGVNLYTTIMMPTGAGKDSIRKFCSRILCSNQTPLGVIGASFMGAQNYTGPKALLRQLQIRPSMLSVMTEAGLLFSTDSGDKSGLLRVILQAYTSSGAIEVIQPEEYSSRDDSIGMIYAPALTILNEATPVTLQRELRKRQSLNTGELPRMWIFNITGRKPYPNPEPHKLELSSAVSKSLQEVMSQANSVQSSEPPQVIDLGVPDWYTEFSYECVDLENELAEEDSNKAIMYSRAAHKVLKVAALCAILDNPESPSVGIDHWTWARHLFEYEMDNIKNILGEDQVVAALDEACKYIVRLLKGEYNNANNKNKYNKPELCERGIFLESPFKQCAAGSGPIKNCGDSMKYSSPKSGAMKVLQFLVSEGYITKVKANAHMRGSSVGYKITRQFEDYVKTNQIQ